MNIRTPSNLTSAVPVELGMFDIARWKPCTPEQFVSLFAEQSFTVGDDEPIASSAGDLPDGRIRMVVYARMKPLGSQQAGTVQPHLTIIYDPESRKSMTMMRTDVELDKDLG